MLRVLMEKMTSMQEHMCNVSREVETQRKNQKEMLKVKNTVTEMENAFDGPSVDWLDLTEEQISECEDM